MNFLKRPDNGVWVAVQDDINNDSLRERILAADVCISDLDDTDTISPAKMILGKAAGTSHFSPRYWMWCLGTACSLVWNGKSGEARRWNKYVKRFLSDWKGQDEVIATFTRDVVEATFYPGVKELYHFFGDDVKKFYVTRNILHATAPYATTLGFAGSHHSVFNKRKFMECFVKDFPVFQRYFVKGDSEEEEEMADFLRFCKRERRIEDVVYCHMNPRYNCRKLSREAEVNVGNRSYEGLVEILQS